MDSVCLRPILKHAPTARANQLYALLLVLIAATTIGAFFLIWLHGAIPRKPSSSTIDLIVEAYRGLMAPEPTEQFVFAVLTVLVPVFALIAAAAASTPGRFANARRTDLYLPPLVALLFLWTVLGSDFVPTVVRDFLKPYSRLDSLYLVAALLVAAIVCPWLAKRKRDGRRVLDRRWNVGVAWAVFLAAVVLQMVAWRVVSFASVLPISPWQGHADPLFYVMAQVQAGKTLLFDLPSQYGLFPEMLGPVFGLIGLTVGRVTLLFGALQLLSMAGLFYVLQQFVRSRIVLTIAGLALVLLTFETVLLNANYEERYFQYWPLRFFWPAASVVLFHWFSRAPSYGRAAAMSILSAVAMLWNLDSGLFIVVAFGAYLAARAAMVWRAPAPHAAGGWSVRKYGTALLAHILITAFIASAFLVGLEIKAGHPLHLRWLVEYQKVFADLGLAMLPLPRKPHPWMATLAIYLAGMLQAFFMWKRAGRTSVRADMIFYLSILGLGLFVYYAGRSHILNLVTVCWPAAMLIAIYADEILRRVRAGALPVSTLSVAALCTGMLLLTAGSFLARVPSLAERTWKQVVTRGQTDDPIATNELAFIKHHAAPGSACLILALRQGIYHAQSEVASPFVGPGIIETVLLADQQRMMAGVFAGDYPCLFVGVGPLSVPNFRIDMAKVLERYAVADESPGRTMLFLRPKPQ